MGPDKLYFKGLNGIRAVAALAVLLFHSLPMYKFSLFNNAVMGQQGGEYGVTVFFTLSGFLITYLLLLEKENTGTVSLKKFYMRRILRIWPLYYFFIILVVVTYMFIFKLHINHPENILYFLTFFGFIPFKLRAYPMCMGHLWSVGVEEMFYAFWPFVLKRIKKIKFFLIIFIISIILIRSALAALAFFFKYKIPYDFATALRFDCMAIGAYFAVLYYEKNTFLLKFSRNIFIPIGFWVLTFLSVFYKFHFFLIYSDVVTSLISAFFIISQISNTKNVTTMENPVMNFLGKISYGIYIYHFLFIAAIPWTLRKIGVSPHPVIILSLTYTFTIITAYLSYNLLEKPFLKRKESFAIIKSGKI